jgi:hypothetical protein
VSLRPPCPGPGYVWAHYARGKCGWVELLPEEPPVSDARKGEYEVPQHARQGHCRSCDAPVIWTTGARGGHVPLSVASIVERDGKQFALSHFADCKHAKAWSKKGK